MLATMNFGSVFTIGPAIMKGLIGGKEIFDLIEREPKISSPKTSNDTKKIMPTEGLTLKSGIKF